MSQQNEQKQSLRNNIQRQRKALTQAALTRASNALAQFSSELPILNKAKTVLSYSPTNGEIDPAPITDALQNATIYLPRVVDTQNRTMTFHQKKGALIKNRYGIEEPAINQPSLSATELDAVLVPLVAFDRNGTRLGMGGGFYDTSFAFRLNRTDKRPFLIGLAHEFQEVNDLEAEAWDVPLDAILTDRQLITIT